MKKYRKKRKSNETEKKNEKMTRSTRRETGWEKRKCPVILGIFVTYRLDESICCATRLAR